MKQSLPFGMWKGKISADLVAERTRINTLKWDGDDLVFSVSKNGKSYLYRKSFGMPWIQINGEYPVYGSVGYGGGDFDAQGGKTLFCAGKYGLRLHEAGKNSSRQLTQDTLEHASPAIHPSGKLAVYICSDGEHDQMALINLAAYDWPKRLIWEADFYMQPEWSPDGKKLAWVQWDHPNMPWSGASVWLASFDEKQACIQNIQKIAGGVVFPASQPHFSPDGQWLSFIETRENWDDLVCLNLSNGSRHILIHGNGFCLADPAFSQGICSYAWLPNGKELIYTRVIGTRNELYRVELSNGKETKISEDCRTVYDQICVSKTGAVAAITSGPLDFPKVVVLRNDTWETVWQGSDMVLDTSFISVPQEITWKAVNGTDIFALYYPPCNPNYEWYGAPPAIIQIHGGPTGQADRSFSPEIAYFTSLGYAYVRVNYRGSSGFGRKYIESLNGHWGEYDTADAADCAKYLVKQGLADGKRLLITGGSSGGYAVLNALVQYPDVFTAGASLYGVSNLYSLVSDTHKLELHYTDSLVGTLPGADEKYWAWSPMFHMEQVRVPLAIFQGDSDKVVPPDQSKGLLSTLKVPYVFRLYEGEGHGFHQPEHIRDYLETLHEFLQKYL